MSAVLITGSAKRIGQQLAFDLAKSGYDIVLHYNTSQQDAFQTASLIEEQFQRRVWCFQADLMHENGADKLFSAIQKENIPLTALINNASVFEPDSLPEMTYESWNKHMMIHAWTPARLSQLFAEYYHKTFPEKRHGNIINMIDQRVKRMTPYFFSYTVSKCALWTMTQTMAMELSPYIRVNAIGPGPTVANPRQSKEDFEKQFEALPLRQSISPSELANAVLFILSSPSMTGNLLTVDGGQHLAWETPDVVGITE